MTTTAEWIERRPTRRPVVAHPVVWYVIAGVVTTGLQELIFLATRLLIGSVVGNIVAIAITTVLNTEFQRRVTFAGMHTSPLRLHLQSAGTFAFYAGYGSLVLLSLQAITPSPSATVEAIVLAAASMIGGILRFAVLRWWVFTTR
ncbi:MAG TPA: GtrA family protein [Amycolatopsis sp.]|nr:GtrA family protein [Amycolatopsis sp.]